MTETANREIRTNVLQRHLVSVDPAVEQLRCLIDGFVAHVEELPSLPFDLGAGMHLADPSMFYASL